MQEELRKHDVLAYEVASKFELHKEVLLEMSEAVEAIKTFALVTDLHLEAY
jgi:hypothetical protein